jgi:ParB/RepB/Spo0J family partition protein
MRILVETEISTLPLDCISPDLGQPRKYFDRIEELAEDIKQNGLLTAICVRPLENGKYRIIHGERRYRAVLLLGWTEIRCEIKIGLTEEQIRNIQLSENLERTNLSPLELGKEFDRRLMETPGLTTDALAKTIHRSRAFIWKRLKLLQLSPEIQKKILKHKISMSNALDLLQHVPDAKDRERIADDLAPDMSSRKFQASLKASGFLKGDENNNVTRVTQGSSDEVVVKTLKTYYLIVSNERVKWTELMAAFGQDLKRRGV